MPLHLTVVSLSPERPALVLQQMTEMEINVPENFPDEDEELEETEGDGQPEDDDPDRSSVVPETSSSPTLISRLANLFSSSDDGEHRIKVKWHQILVTFFWNSC